MTERAFFCYKIGSFLLAMNELDIALNVFRREYYLEPVSKSYIEKSQQERSDSLKERAKGAVKKGTFSKADSDVMADILTKFDSYRDIRNLVAHGTLAVSDLPLRADGFSPMVLHYQNSEDSAATKELKANGSKGTVRLAPISVLQLSQYANEVQHLSDQLFEILAVRQLHPDLSERVALHLKSFKAGESRNFLEVKKDGERKEWEEQQAQSHKQ